MSDTGLYRRAALARLVHVSGRWLISSPAVNQPVLLPPALARSVGAIEAVLASAAVPSSRVALLERAARHSEATDAEALVDALINCGLLVPPHAETPWDRWSGSPAESAARYMATKKAVRFLDYSDPEVHHHDRAVMERYLKDGPPPPVDAAPSGARIELPHPAFGLADTGAARVGYLLFSGFGTIRRARFLDLFPVLLKPVPSKGARHPFDALLRVRDSSLFDAGLYRYLSTAHALAVKSRGPAEPGPAATLTVLAIYDRVQWRYRESASYKDLFLDLGHLTETLRQVASQLRVALEPRSEQPPVGIPMVEEPVASFDLEPEEDVP